MLVRTTQYLIETQNNLIKKNNLIEEVNRNLFESIGFANLIQKALLPDKSALTAKVTDGDYRVINQIGIGGDSVFVKETEDSVTFGLLDATGHGIPAAMLSISAILILAELSVASAQNFPAEIITELHKRLHSTFNQHQSIAHLEGTLCRYIPHEKRLYYSCAKGKGIRITGDGQLSDLDFSNYSIGEDIHANYKTFTLNCAAGDQIILYSDGLTDQFGGDKNKKFSRRRLRDLIMANRHHSASDLSEIIYRSHLEWKGIQEQTDDISFMILSF